MTGPPRDRVTQLLEALPDEQRAAVAAWVADPEGRPLERHLGLDRLAHRLAVRNHHLRRAYDRMDPALSRRGRRLVLAAEIRRFAAAAWPQLKDLTAPDPSWSALRRELWLAFKVGGAVPATERHIYEIIGREISYHTGQARPASNPRGRE